MCIRDSVSPAVIRRSRDTEQESATAQRLGDVKKISEVVTAVSYTHLVNQQAGVIEDVRITFGVAAPVPYRCTKAEEALKGYVRRRSNARAPEFIEYVGV